MFNYLLKRLYIDAYRITVFFIFYFHLLKFLYELLFENEAHHEIRLRREHIQKERIRYDKFLSLKEKDKTEEHCEKDGIILIEIFNNRIIEKSLKSIDFEDLEYIRFLLHSYLYDEKFLTRPDLSPYLNYKILNDPECVYYLNIILFAN